MPQNTKAMHPSGLLGITFTEDDHSYIDDFGIDYTSGTTLVKSAFEEFDAKIVSAKKSAKTGVPADQYIAEWKAASERAAIEGTRAHENCERQILGRIADMNQPQDDDERARFRAAWFEVEKLKAAFPSDFMRRSSLEPEKIIFSPRFRVSGSVDLLAHRSDGRTMAQCLPKADRRLRSCAAARSRTGGNDSDGVERNERRSGRYPVLKK